MNRSMLVGALALGWLLLASLSPASALSIVLDVTNGYSADIEPGATLSQPSFASGFNFIVGTGVEFAFGDSSSAVFPGQTQIGNGVLLGGNRPAQLVQGSLPFTMRVTSNDHRYDALLTYFLSFESGAVGNPPIPVNDAGAVFIYQGPIEQDLAPVPEPATLLLFGTTAAGLGLARWRRRHRQ